VRSKCGGYLLALGNLIYKLGIGFKVVGFTFQSTSLSLALLLLLNNLCKFWSEYMQKRCILTIIFSCKIGFCIY
jgi:hypothetical protein